MQDACKCARVKAFPSLLAVRASPFVERGPFILIREPAVAARSRTQSQFVRVLVAKRLVAKVLVQRPVAAPAPPRAAERKLGVRRRVQTLCPVLRALAIDHNPAVDALAPVGHRSAERSPTGASASTSPGSTAPQASQPALSLGWWLARKTSQIIDSNPIPVTHTR